MFPIVLEPEQKLSEKQAEFIFGDSIKDEQRLKIETRGPWGIISKCKGLVVHMDFETRKRTIYGYRTLSKVKQSGYELEGKVSLFNVSYSAFTSSDVFHIENGNIIDVGTIFPRLPKEEDEQEEYRCNQCDGSGWERGADGEYERCILCNKKRR